MINFFRRIRQNLLNEEKTTKYFEYAIGEIVLAVIDNTVLRPIRDKTLVVAFVVINKTVLYPVRDNTLVTRLHIRTKPRAFRYEI